MPADENKIKQKIELDGEKEYKKALNDSYRELKTLRSELKAETAELGANATAQQKNEVRMKSLQKQIKEQAKIVDTYKKALDEVKEKYSDNEDEIAKWEQKLNGARTTLANMQNELEGVNNTFKEMQTDAGMATVATKSVADSLGSIATVGGNVSESIEGLFTNMLGFVKDTISDIWADIVDLAARSNGLVDLAGFWNTDVTTIQKYKGAVESVSGTLEDLSSIVTKINAGDNKKITELTGVSKELYKDEWEYAMAVMSAMSKMDTQTRNNAAFEIFGGKQATKAFDLLNDWDKLLTKLDKFDVEKGGYGLTEEELQSMSELADRVNELHSSWSSLKDMATVKLFGQLSLDLTGNAQAIVDGFLKYFNAGSDDERAEALKEIETNITQMFETAKKAIEDGVKMLDDLANDLKNSDNPTAQSLGNILGGLVAALKWITEDNMNRVVHALGILVTFWAGGKVLKIVGTVASFAKNLAAIKAFKALNIGLTGAEEAGAAAGASWGRGFAAAVAKAAPWLIGLYTLLNPAASATEQEDALWDEQGNVTEAGKRAGVTETKKEEEKSWAESEEGKKSIWGGLGDLIEAGGKVTKEQYVALNHLWENYTGQVKTNETQEQLLESAQKKFEGEEEKLAEFLKLIFELRNSGMRPKELPLEWFGVSSEPEAEEYIDLTPKYTKEEKDNAIQDWWDSWKEGAEDEASNLDWMKETLGDEFADVWESIMQHLDELEERQMQLEDIPSEWWLHGSESGEGITNENLTAFNSLPGKMEKAVAKAVGGIRVYLDGQAVGNLVTPYVSQNIALDIG